MTKTTEDLAEALQGSVLTRTEPPKESINADYGRQSEGSSDGKPASLDERRLAPPLDSPAEYEEALDTFYDLPAPMNLPITRSRSSTNASKRSARELIRRASSETTNTLDFDSDVGELTGLCEPR
jgi:hypothetical protein